MMHPCVGSSRDKKWRLGYFKQFNVDHPYPVLLPLELGLIRAGRARGTGEGGHKLFSASQFVI